MKKINLILLLILTLIFVSCTMGNNGDENLNVSADDSQLIERSEAIADKVVEQFGIDDAVAIVFNEYAIIAVKIAYDDDISQQQISEITNTVKNYDTVEEVLITDNPKVFREIDDIVFGILQGDPYNNYLDDINNIKNRLSRSSS